MQSSIDQTMDYKNDSLAVDMLLHNSPLNLKTVLQLFGHKIYGSLQVGFKYNLQLHILRFPSAWVEWVLI